MHLPQTTLKATYRAPTHLPLPCHTGSLFRGLLGRALHDTPDLYNTLFDPQVPSPPPIAFLRGQTRAPSRIIPSFPRGGDRSPGEVFAIRLAIVGDILPSDVRRVEAALQDIARLPIGVDGGRIQCVGVERDTSTSVLRIDPAVDNADQRLLRIRFITPAWLDQGPSKNLAVDMTFGWFFRALHRRLSTLAALYGTFSASDEEAFQTVAPLAQDVRVIGRTLRALRWERVSLERNERLPQRGLVGSLVCEGPLGPLMPYLRAGELLHVGKETSFGLGRFALEGAEVGREVDAGLGGPARRRCVDQERPRAAWATAVRPSE